MVAKCGNHYIMPRPHFWQHSFCFCHKNNFVYLSVFQSNRIFLFLKKYMIADSCSITATKTMHVQCIENMNFGKSRSNMLQEKAWQRLELNYHNDCIDHCTIYFHVLIDTLISTVYLSLHVSTKFGKISSCKFTQHV